MKQILMIEVSPRGKDSASRAVADTLAARLTALHSSAKLVRRDLAAELNSRPRKTLGFRTPAEAFEEVLQ